MAVSGNIATSLSFTETKALDLSTASESFILSLGTTFSDGTGINACNKKWHDQRTISSGVGESLDLSGSLTNIYGDSVNFTAIKVIIIQNLAAAAGSILQVTSNPTNTWASIWYNEGGFSFDSGIKIVGGYTAGTCTGGVFCMVAPTAAGYAVTAGTADQLRFDQTSGSDLTYNIFLAGI
jgi:hypothetical protein